jgi:DNA modification methylase
MAVKDQQITEEYAIYNGDCVEVMQGLPADKVHLSVYSPPFGGLYHYSSDDRDLSNCADYDEFFRHYEYVVREIHRITMPGRITAVHCMDVPRSNSGKGDSYIDFPGDIIRLHERLGFEFRGRRAIWKEPLAVRLRTMQKNLAHATIVQDAAASGVAAADYVLMFAKKGSNPVPVHNPTGLSEYAGEREIPAELWSYRNWEGKQTENRFSHWIWRQYASSFWDDIRIDRVLPFQDSREEDDEKHVHPLQLDVIDRIVTLYSNKGETVLTPFMGVGSEVYSPILLGRKALGIELKTSYYRQAVKNCDNAAKGYKDNVENLELAI